MKLDWSDKALNDLERIGAYISRDDPKAANRFVTRLWKRAATLKTHPRLGRIVPEFGDESLRELIEGAYRVVYRVEKNTVTIVTVFEGHRLFRTDEKEE